MTTLRIHYVHILGLISLCEMIQLTTADGSDTGERHQIDSVTGERHQIHSVTGERHKIDDDGGCDVLGRTEDCRYYTSCLEPVYNCGEHGYLVSYGHKYCARFSKPWYLFTNEGMLWKNKVRPCLIRHLVAEHRETPAVTCETLKVKAFSSHVTCYLEGGICELPVYDYLILLMHLDLLNDFITGDDAYLSVTQALQTADQCMRKLGYYYYGALLSVAIILLSIIWNRIQ